MLEYEQKYGFVDISRLHESVRINEATAEQSSLRAHGLEKDLFEMRNRILTATKKFDRGEKVKEDKKEDEETKHWNLDIDVDKICAVLDNFVTDVKTHKNFYAPSDPAEASIGTANLRQSANLKLPPTNEIN